MTIEMQGDAQCSDKNLFKQKNQQCLSVLCGGKCLHLVRSCSKESSSCEVSTSPSPFVSRVGEYSESESEKVISSSSKTYSEGTLQSTIRANETPHFVFKLENQKDVYVASYVNDQSVYMIHLQRRGESSSSSSSSLSYLVGIMKVSTLFSERRTIEREFVLFSNIGLSEKVVYVRKNTKGMLRLSRTSFMCSWNQKLEEPNFDLEQENNLPTNLETLAVLVKEETIEEDSGGWGLKFLKTEPSTSMTSMNVVIPSGIHGGPEDRPLSLIKRWRSQGNCDCEGWDLGCSLTLLKGQTLKKQLELFLEGRKHETPGFRIVNGHGGQYLVQFDTKLSVLQSFSIALAFIHINI